MVSAVGFLEENVEADSLAGAVSIQRVVSLSRRKRRRRSVQRFLRVKDKERKTERKEKEKKRAGRLERTMSRTKRTAPGDGDGSRNRGQSWSVVGGVKPRWLIITTSNLIPHIPPDRADRGPREAWTVPGKISKWLAWH